MTIETGDTVRWEFDQAATTHTVTSTGSNWPAALDESRGPNGAPIERTFNTPGTYTFLCQIHNGMTGSITVEEPGLDRVLVFSKTGGFRHDSIPQGIAAIQELGQANDFTVVATEDAAQFNDANLATFDVVVFLSTTGEVLNDAQQAAFERYIQGGGGYAGIHAAADTEYSWPWYGELVGGYFRNHPPGTPNADVKIEDGDEPSTSGLPATWNRNDEWYNYQHPTTPIVNGSDTTADFSPRARQVKVLATVDEASYDEQDGTSTADDHPIAWCSNFDGGISWYTGMGHTQASYSDANFRAHILGGLRTAAGLGGDCGEEREMPPTADDFEKVTLSDDTNAPMEIDIAEDGRAFFIERDGRVQMWSPTTKTVTTLVTIPVTNSQENGLLGIQLSPDFETTGHIYLAYSALPDSSNQNRISRFTLSGNSISLSSEQIIYTWQHQRAQCCHTAGSIDFGPDGSLYLSTGDNTNPFAHGFNPTDERPGRAFWDAQRTSANTNDPNGKIIRIKPIPGVTGVQPGIGSTYTIPEGNMFPESEDTENKTLPEIYAMGFRNPFRIHVDQKTGWVLLGDYGPDAGSTNPDRGPQGSVEFNVVKGPGFYGWPYCVRDNVPYRDITYQSDEGGTPPPNVTYIDKGPYDCNAPVNDSPNNTGLTNLPPAQPATMWMGYSQQDPRFTPDLGGGGAPTGGPRYYFDEDNTSDTKFPRFFDGHWFIGEWNNDWIKTTTLNDQGNATGVACFAICTGYQSPMDIEFGPNGSLYVVEWGQGFGSNNPDSGVYRIDYLEGNRSPIAVANVDNDAVPVGTTVQFSSAGSNDPDGTDITYLWDFKDGTPTSTAPNPSHTFTAAGTYDVTLTVTDESGDTAVDTVRVVVGNQRPVVTIEFPENGKVADFGDKVEYKVSVVDPDGSGPIDCDKVLVEFKLGHDEHAHELSDATGCEGDFTLTGVAGHGIDANVFTVVIASYTDEGNGPAAPVTGTAEAILQPKLKQAEYFSTTGRTADGRGTGDPGVQREDTTDVGGGSAAAFIEDGDWISFTPYNLEDLSKVTFRVASAGAGGIIQLRYDAADGPLVAETPNIAPTGGWQTWRDVTIDLPDTIPAGTHRLFVVFRHPTATGSLMNLNWFKFIGKGAAVTAPPEVSVTAEPLSGEAPLNVAFNATATDEENEALTYAWDFGVPGTNDDTSTEEDPNYTYTSPGNYTATVTVTDASGGKSSASVEVRVTRPLEECPTGPVRSDEFDGTSLDTNRWTVERPDTANPFSVSDGYLNLPIANGSMYGAGTTAKNIIVQDTPDGEWMATAKITASALSENYHQAGLRVWAGDDNWASVHMIYAGTGRDIEFIYESNGNPRNEAADKLGGIPADAPLTYYVRLVSDGENLTAFYSYDGVQFLPVGRPASLATFNNPKIGPAALSDLAPSVPMARFDWIRFDPDSTGGTNNQIVDEFEGTELNAAWQRIRGDQSAIVSGGTYQIPAQPGDIYGTRNDAKNLTVREAPSGPWTAVAKINFEGTAQYHQAGIMVYGDDDNFTKFGRLAHTAAGDEKFEFIYENNAQPRNEAADSTANLPEDFPDDYYLRITSDGTNIVGHYSTNGTDWTLVGRPAPLPANAKLGLFAFANDGTGNPIAAFDSFTLTTPGGGGGTPSGPRYDDEFDSAELDKNRWNAIVRDTPSEYSLSGGELTLTLSQGDIYTGDTNPPPNNFILQDASHAGADWVIETKITDYTHDGGYAQGGLLAYADGDNYVKFDIITDPGQTTWNRIELRSEVGGQIQNPQANANLTGSQREAPVWLRLIKEGNNYSGQYSFDGVAWTDFPQGPVQNPMQSPDFGIFGFSPQEPQAGTTVTFDYFQLDGPDPSECECVEGPGDEFNGTSLDKSRWNAIVTDDPSKYSVANGALTVTTTAGEIYQGGTGGGPIILQSADHAGADWTIETKLTNDLDGGYSQGG
ncbi:MAG TPA: ThuA domain-containing protein, partial [Solirubrobacter sp.]|nr:ThuA domain-containing protein [Solirubrobacter sp.]